MKPRVTAGVLVLSALVLLANGQAHADEAPALLKVVPSDTSVLLLPALDTTKDAEHMQGPRQSVVQHWEQFEFITRHFKVMGSTMAAQAADAEPKIELGKSSSRTSDNLDVLAKRAGADLIVDVHVEEAKMDAESGGGSTIRTRIRLQIWDARRHNWVINGPFTGEVHDAGSPVFAFRDSLAGAVKSALTQLLAAYPQIVSVSEEHSLKDYLAGQTEPFLGNPKTPFGGL